MKTKEQIWEKVERDQVMNLSELAVASGYPRCVLSAMKVPLIAGKISLSDFKRILRKRQDQCENLWKAPAKPPASSPDTKLHDPSSIRSVQTSTALTAASDLFFGRKNPSEFSRKASDQSAHRK